MLVSSLSLMRDQHIGTSTALISIAPVFGVKNPTLDCFKFTFKPIGPMLATLSLPSVKTCASCPKGLKEHHIARYKQPNTCLQFFCKGMHD